MHFRPMLGWPDNAVRRLSLMGKLKAFHFGMFQKIFYLVEKKSQTPKKSKGNVFDNI